MSSETPAFRSILIYGMGMMGASLALAVRARWGSSVKITGVVRSEASGEVIRKQGLADSALVSSSPAEIRNMDLSAYDFIILGIPIKSIVSLAGIFPAYTGLITDMSSTRKEVAEAFRKRPDLRFIGSHPMCGSEDAGPGAARPDLYQDRLCILVDDPGHPSAESEQRRMDRTATEEFWKNIGMKTLGMSPAVHDEVLAHLSHTPHLLAGLLTLWAQSNQAVSESTKNATMPITGGGFRDMSRISGSNPEMWTDILETNRDAVLQSLKTYASMLSEMIESVEKKDRSYWLDWFSRARKARNFLSGYPEDK